MSIIVPRFRFPIGYDACNPTTPAQKQEKLLFNRTWFRFETTCINTNTNFTLKQLQMRMKAEVLQHKQKHIRHHTKKEKYALASRKHYSKRHYIPKVHIDENGNLVSPKNTIIDNNIVFFNNSCDNVITVHKSTASDVPGPPIDLFLDSNVPLKNRENPLRTYRVGSSYNVDDTVLS